MQGKENTQTILSMYDEYLMKDEYRSDVHFMQQQISQQNMMIKEMQRNLVEPNLAQSDLRRMKEIDQLKFETELMRLEKKKALEYVDIRKHEEKQNRIYKEEMDQVQSLQKELLEIMREMSRPPVERNGFRSNGFGGGNSINNR